MQKTKEEEFLKLFDRWKEEEKEKLVGEMEKVKEMFMKEFKELTSKNSALEYVSIGSSLVVQWLGLWASTAEGTGLIAGWGTKIPQATWHYPKIPTKNVENM